MIVGLTGGIGSGKSTVAKMFKKIGVPVYDSDFEAKRLMHSNKNIVAKIKTLFGEEAYVKEKLNRTYIAKMVFNDKPLLAQLNAIVHPAVKEHFTNWVANQNANYVIQETALIFENNTQNYYDKVILVTAPLAIRIERVIKRDQIKEEAVLNRVKNQLTDQEKIKLADYVVENINLDDTEKKITQLHTQLLKISGN